MTVLAAPEVTSVMDTWTPGIAAPDCPLTVPVIDPPATCALTAQGVPSETHRATKVKRIGISFRPLRRSFAHTLAPPAHLTKKEPSFDRLSSHSMLPPRFYFLTWLPAYRCNGPRRLFPSWRKRHEGRAPRPSGQLDRKSVV